MADIWVLGNSVVTANVFADSNEESSATLIEGLGHTVTRYQGSTISTAPTTADCDVVIHFDGGVGGEFVLRATEPGSAPIIACNTYYWANAYGHTCLATGPTGTGNSDADWEILDTTEIAWTDGYAVNDTVTVWPWDLYQEAVQGVVSGSIPVIATVSPGYNTCVLVPSGTTNIAATDTVANVALFNIWSDGFRLNTAGGQILDDVITWAIGPPISFVTSQETPQNNASSINVGVPTSDLADGDVLVIFVAPDELGPFNPGTPGDFDDYGALTRDFGEASLTWAVRVVTDASTEPSTHTFSAGHGGVDIAATCLVFRGVDNTTPIDATTTTGTGTGTSIATPSITTVSDEAAVVRLVSQRDPEQSFTWPSSTDQVEYGESYLDGSLAVGWAIQATAGASGVETVTVGSSDTWAVATIALRPGGGAPPAQEIATTGLDTSAVFGSPVVADPNAPTPDFKIQRGTADVSANNETTTLTAAVGSLDSAFVVLTSNRHTGGGDPGLSASNLGVDDLSVIGKLTDTSTITWTRPSTTPGFDCRVEWEVWEYIGPSGGANEFIVRDRTTHTLTSGTTDTFTISGVSDADACVPFLQGFIADGSANDSDKLSAAVRLTNATTVELRNNARVNSSEIGVVVVEFTGANWSVGHASVADTGVAESGTYTLNTAADGTSGSTFDVGDWATAAIVSWGSSTNDEALADHWPLLEPGSGTTTVDWTLDSQAVIGEMTHTVHVLQHDDLAVTRYTDTSNTAGDTAIDITSAGLTDLAQSSVLGTATSSGGGTAFARGWRTYRLTDLTTATHWCHRSGNTMNHRIEVIDWTGIETAAGSPAQGATASGLDAAASFGAVTLSSVAVAAPTGLDASAAIGAPSLTTSIDLAPAGASAGASFGSPALDASVTVPPTGLAASPGFGDPSLVPGPVDITAIGVDAAAGFGAPATSATATLTPASLAAGASFGTPEAIPDLFVEPTGVDAAASFGAPSFDSLTAAAPSGLDATPTFGTPAAAPGPVSASATGLSAPPAFGAPTTQAGPVDAVAGAHDASAVIPAPTLIVGGVSVAPTGLVAVPSFGASTLTAGSVAITPTGVDTAAGFGTPTGDGTARLTVAGIDTTATFGDATLDPGPTGTTATGLDAAASFGAPALDAGAVAIDATGLDTTATFGDATLAAGAVAVEPAGLDTAASFGDPALTPGDAAVAASGLDSSPLFGEPTGEVEALPGTIAPAGLDAAASFGDPVLNAGLVSRTATALDAAASFGAPTLVAVTITAPTGYDAAATFGTPTLDVGAVAVTVTSFDAAPSFGAAALDTGAIAIAPTGHANPASFGSPTLAGTYTVTTTGLDATPGFGTPGSTVGATLVSPDGYATPALFGAATVARQVFGTFGGVRSRSARSAVATSSADAAVRSRTSDADVTTSSADAAVRSRTARSSV